MDLVKNRGVHATHNINPEMKIKHTHLVEPLAALAMCSMTTGLSAAEPFEVVIIPDSQHYSHFMDDGGPDLFTHQTSWIRDNVTNSNIAFVTHVGDVIHDNTGLWPYASQAMSPLDGAVPYSVTFGNHDNGEPGPFASSRYQSYPWYVGASSDNLAHAQTFTAGGITFLHINVPHDANNAQLTWAQSIITANPGKPTIISTHGYMADNTFGRATRGENIWTTLVEPNTQVFMTCNGHDWVSRHEVDTTNDGRKILQIQSNWQQVINGGNGLLQRVVFDPDNSKITVKTYSPFLDLYHTDYSGEFSYSATMSSSAVVIGNELGAPKRTWDDGAKKNDNWQDAANWDGTAPSAGDRLFFGATGSGSSVNDFTAGTAFSGIVFNPGTFSNGYTLSGNKVNLTGDIVNMGTYGSGAGSGPKINFPIELVGDRQFNTGDWDMTVNGVISGTGSLTKTHGRDYFRGSYDGGVYIGDLYLTQVNTYTGDTRVSGGALILDNNSSNNLMPSSPNITLDLNAVLRVVDLQNGTFNLVSGQTLRGSGKVSGHTTASSGSTLAPGNGAQTGRLNLFGDLAMNSGSSLDLELAGKDEGSYDQTSIQGTVNLGSATLNLASMGGYTPAIGDQLIILQNDGVDAISGTFTSGSGSDLTPGTVLGEGVAVSTNFLGSGYTARISYAGGDGNDVSIVVLPPPGAPVFITDPIVKTGAEPGSAYVASIAGSALDGDGDTLTYSKVSGPSWLTVSSNGDLSGTPGASDAGTSVQFTVQVSDGNGGSDTALLQVDVLPLVGLWKFDDPADLAKASIGQDLVLTGTDQAVAGFDAGDGAARIGVGSHYALANTIGANGGGSYTNEYTLVFDVSYPASSENSWMSFFQTAPNNGNDADCFVRGSQGTIGVSGTGYSGWVLPKETWARIIVSVDNGSFYRIYANGSQILNGSIQSVDGTYALESTLLLFADNNGEDNAMDVTSVRLFDRALTAAECAALGGVPSSTSSSDSDGDGLDDSWEITHFGSLAVSDGTGDADSDGLADLEEFTLGTNPNAADSDGDGYGDALEVAVGTGPQDNQDQPAAAYAGLVGWWKFDDAQDLTKASLGQDLGLVGSHQTATGYGPGDGAARIGVGSHYQMTHGIGANGGGSYTNEYTLVLDISYPASSTNTWMSLFQTASSNANDGDCFIRNSNGTIGLSATGYSSWSLASDTWVRLVVSVDNGSSYKIYADGTQILNGSTQTVDGRFSLESVLLLFADNNGEDNPIDVTSVRIYDRALNATEAANLGDVEGF
ncbi:hypothetical protein Rhal01_02464 [Rubritalea halochordaticola]|uniref:Calcineurin-like phosphoesterase domain-containing protein n=2 Tax=Rubritalea halochordaticola TaxID=714537 RepID=A0ABP9V5A5_9BACT